MALHGREILCRRFKGSCRSYILFVIVRGDITLTHAPLHVRWNICQVHNTSTINHSESCDYMLMMIIKSRCQIQTFSVRSLLEFDMFGRTEMIKYSRNRSDGIDSLSLEERLRVVGAGTRLWKIVLLLQDEYSTPHSTPPGSLSNFNHQN